MRGCCVPSGKHSATAGHRASTVRRLGQVCQALNSCCGRHCVILLLLQAPAAYPASGTAF